MRVEKNSKKEISESTVEKCTHKSSEKEIIIVKIRLNRKIESTSDLGAVNISSPFIAKVVFIQFPFDSF